MGLSALVRMGVKGEVRAGEVKDGVVAWTEGKVEAWG
jgi:hypothetical protein